MDKNKLAVSAALSGLLALGAVGTTTTAVAGGGDKERCYGVVKAGKNDCQTNTTSCAGTSTTDDQGDAWVYVPKGLCEKLTGGSTESKS